MDGVILYLHGFCSSPASWKAKLLGDYMAGLGLAAQFVCPTLFAKPADAIAQLEALIAAASGPVTLVGSSLGGHYASYLAEKHDLKAVLINPAIIDRVDLGLFLGEHENFHSGERFTFTAAEVAELLAQVVVKPTPERYWLLTELADEVLDAQQAIARYAGCRQTVLPGGDHSFTRFGDYLEAIVAFAASPGSVEGIQHVACAGSEK